jgi:tetratricopeptide (TPR) repeat protein
VIRLFIAGVTLAALIFTPHAAAQEAEDTWKDLVTQGQRAAANNQYATAEPIFLKAVHEAERFGTDDWRVGATLESLGQVYTAEKKFTDAEAAYRRALGIMGKADGGDNEQAANLNFDMANLMFAASRLSEALVYARNALTSYETTVGGTSLQTAAALCLIGDSLRTMKNFIDAEAQLKRCADIREADGGIDDTDLASALHSLALTYAGEGKYALAEPRFKLAEKIRESKLGLTSPLLAKTMEDHAAMLRTLGRTKEADRLTLLSAAIRRREKKN